MASSVPPLSIGRLATIRRKPSVPISDSGAGLGYAGVTRALDRSRHHLYDCTNKMDLSTKKPPRQPSQIVASQGRSLGIRQPAWMEDFAFHLQNSDIREQGGAWNFGILIPTSNKPILPC
jgi:hypothetical protein